MNFFEKQVEKYERRIKRIEESPSASMLASNKVLYEMTRKHWLNQLKWWEDGEPFAWCDGIAPEEILHAMGIHVVNMEMLSYQAIPDAPKYIDIGQAAGLSVDLCSSIRAEWGMCLSEELPPPAFVVTMSANCESCYKACYLFAHHHKVPIYAIDSPYHGDSDDSVPYLVEQYREFIKFAEDITGHKFDEDSLRRKNGDGGAAVRLQEEIYELRKAIPCPVAGRDTIRLGMAGSGGGSLKYLEGMRDEIKARVDKKQGAIPGEKVRLGWLQTAPLYTDTFTFLEKLGAPIVASELGTLFTGGGGSGRDVEMEPLERMAKGHIRSANWYGPIERRMEWVLEMCREFKVDAVVHFSQWGCRCTNTAAGLVRDRLEKELGIPTLILEGDYMDVRNYNQAEYEETLEQFVKMVTLKKGNVTEYDYDKEAYIASQELDEEGLTALGCHSG